MPHPRSSGQNSLVRPSRLVDKKLIFFLREHGDEPCNLIGSYRGPYFPISAHGTFLPSSPIFVIISRFSGWAVFLSKDVGRYLKPMNNLLILSFLSLSNHFGLQKKIRCLIKRIEYIVVYSIRTVALSGWVMRRYK